MAHPLGLNITEITPDPELQELLRQLGNKDEVLNIQEVDSNGDGYLDASRTTQLWPEYLLRRVEHALFSKHLVQKQREHPPLFQMSLNNPSRTSLHIRSLNSFDPQVEPGFKLDLRTQGLGSLVAGAPYLNLAASLQADDPSTPANEGVENIARYLEKEYFPRHLEILTAFRIQDIRRLTPRQAVQLASSIPIERLDYSVAQTKAGMNGNQRIVNDDTPIEHLFSWERDDAGNGVCRNYAEIARGVLDALKNLQDPMTSQLNTTYALQLGLEHDKNVPGYVMDHVWNGYVTLTPAGMEATVLDSTWADDSAEEETKLDFTRERFLTLVENLNEKGLVDTASFAEELFKAWIRVPKADFPTIHASNLKQEFRSPPVNYLIGSQILQIFNDNPLLIDSFRDPLIPFIRGYTHALQGHARQMREAQPLLNPKAFALSMLIPFLQNLQSLVDLCQKLPEGFEEKKNALEACRLLLQEAFDRFGFGFIDYAYAYLQIAETLADTQVADKCIDWISSNSDYYRYHELGKIFETVRPERREIYKAHWNAKTSDIDRLKYPKAASRFGNVYESYILTNQIRPEQREEFDERLRAVFERYSLEDRDYLHRFTIHVQAQPETVSLFDTRSIYFVPSMTSSEIDGLLKKFIQWNRAWDAFQKNGPCVLKIADFLQMVYEPQLMEAIEGAKAYFDQVEEGLVQYKEVTLGDEDQTYDFLHPKISIQHFIHRDFAAVDALLKTHKPDGYPELVDFRKLQKKYMQLEKSPVLAENTLFAIPYAELSIADRFYEPIKQAIEEVEVSFPLLRANPLHLKIKSREKKDPRAPLTLNQGGEVILFSDTPLENVRDSFKKSAQTYNLFLDRLSRLSSHKILFESESAFFPLTQKTWDRLAKLEAFTQPLRNQPDYAEAFDGMKIGFGDDSFAVQLHQGGTTDHPLRQYELRFTARDRSTFIKKLDAFVQQARTLEHRASRIERDYGIKLGFNFEHGKYYTFDYLTEALENTEHFFSSSQPKYNDFAVQIVPSSTYPAGDEMAPFIFVYLPERTISVKAP